VLDGLIALQPWVSGLLSMCGIILGTLTQDAK